MTEITLYNTAKRRKEVLKPLNDGEISLYLCGPTVYDRAHLGNARPAVMFDVLYRLLKHEYPERQIKYVRNITDVDDKINDTARARKAAGDPRSVEALIAERTEETVGWYREDMAALGTLPPWQEPRATGYIAEMIEMIEALITKDAAYEAEGHVLFNVDAYAHYGQLSGRSTDDMIAGARVEVAPYKKNPMDFVLWKPSDAETPGWDSPFGPNNGRGRPGWHIECSAMSKALLGERFDIHGGGIDLQFPHHENEIAQSKCLCGEDSFANIWMHNEMLQVEGKKMSKSLGNFFTVRDLLNKGVPGEVIRYIFLMTHYSKPMDWTEEKARQAEATLRKWGALTEGTEPSATAASVTDALASDLNTPAALNALHALASEGDAAGLKASAEMLGLLTNDLAGWRATEDATTSLINALLNARKEARSAKDFARADAIRDAFNAAGVEVMDSAEGTTWSLKPGFDAQKLEGIA